MINLLAKLLLVYFLFSIKSLSAEIIVVADKNNRFVRTMESNKIPFIRKDNLNEALFVAQQHDGLLLINNKKSPGQHLSLSQQKTIQKKRLHVYLEYPYYICTEKPIVHKINLERGVINSSLITNVPPLSLFTLNDHSFYEYAVQKPLTVIAKVAGFEHAEYGLDSTTVYPGLFRNDQYLISSVSLSDFTESRFGPNEILNNLWIFILQQVGLKDVKVFQSTADVHPRFAKKDKLSATDYRSAIQYGAQWYYNSGLLVHPSWVDLLEKYTKKNGEGVVFPAPSGPTTIGDGSLGILEGHASYIQIDGSQPLRWWLRGDCQAETAFALSSASELVNNAQYKQTAKNLLDYLYKTSNLRAGERNDPQSTSFGLIGWATTDPDAYYGDDNARTLLATIGAGHYLDTEDYYPYVIEGILGNFRTAGSLGFRGPWFRDAKLQTLSWQDIYDKETINYHPHYECWLWANYLWLYDKTGYEPLKDRAIKAITMTMEEYPSWKWTNGIQQEYARMLLPLAWLVRVEDSELHRYWLKMVANVLLQDLDDSGAIKEKLGIKGLGRYDKVKSNHEYGLKEAPLISDYGDQVTDLLYTLNFASFGLNEAYAATQDSSYKAALDKINAFFVKSQVSSVQHKDLDGAWVRAFDFGRWDYWASNADSGWGPWGTQTGWTQSWIINSLTAHVNQQNFWDNTTYLRQNNTFKTLFENRKKSMLNIN